MEDDDGNHGSLDAMNNKGGEYKNSSDTEKDAYTPDSEENEIENDFVEDSNDYINHEDADVVNDLLHL
ncbi:conserved hypothetical protein [Ricinus communis]|uniref:Uncharacterized protein n=1 Tax=Ricinus communis TaxID=3988 RepID=B9T4V7_RICCO|nr:conserved hypothetical protein [Ricinus communis]